MPIREIVIWPDPVLSTPTKLVGEITNDIQMLVTDLIDTCKSVKGIGLAAPQIGVSKRVAVLDVGFCTTGESRMVTLIDPVIEFAEGDQVSEEGCLSVPNQQGSVYRAAFCGVEYTDFESGERVNLDGTELLAAALQHEIDHLDGKVFVEHMPRTKVSIIRRRMTRLKKMIKRKALTLYPTDDGFRL